MKRAAVVLAILASSFACREGPGARRLVDGGRFELPDSGVFFDARPVPALPDAAPADSGPFVCASGCADGSVCGCLDTRPNECGCHEPGIFNEPCDPQHPDTCGWPNQCVRGRKIEGLRYICSDGREGSSCSTVDAICNTSMGCVCQNTPFGVACSCQGNPGPNPLFCNPNAPESCPGGTCVRIESPSGVTHLCSQGRRGEPCNQGDQTCRTSLGCTCPLLESRPVCQCSEPATEGGALCDPRVQGACVSPLECTVVRTETPGAFTTLCSGFGGTPDGGVDPRACDPLRPVCPQQFACEEIVPGVFRCVPQP